jgi:X-X-X-Leu-X-X-Gly heptad repeat protein
LLPSRISRQTSISISVVLGALSLGALGCSDDDWRHGHGPRSNGRNASDVNVVYDRDIDFSQYRTFAIRDDDEADAAMLQGLDPWTRRGLDLVNQRIAVELRELGLSEVPADEADLIGFSLGRTRSGVGVIWSCVGGVWGGYWTGSYYDPCAWLEPVYVDVDRTTLMVGLLDAQLSEVTFAGFVRNVGRGPGSRSRQLIRAVDRIFDRYPGRPPALEPDAGASELDAGAAELDAGATELDAGLAELDAGADPAELDAASPAPDAEAPTVDAGSADGGADAGD